MGFDKKRITFFKKGLTYVQFSRFYSKKTLCTYEVSFPNVFYFMKLRAKPALFAGERARVCRKTQEMNGFSSSHTAGPNGSPFPPPPSFSLRPFQKSRSRITGEKKGVRNENENDYMGKLREGEETLKKKRGEMEGSSLAEYFFSPFFFSYGGKECWEWSGTN